MGDQSLPSSSSSDNNSINKSTNKNNNHDRSSSSSSSSITTSGGGGGGGNNNNNITDDGYEERFNALLNEFANEDNDDNSSLFKCFGCSSPDRIFGLKVDTIIRFFKVITAYPFVIVVSSLNLSNKYAFLR